MSEPQSRFLKCQGRNIHFLEWGDPARDTVIIWHGVTGTCRDHEELAARLAHDYHVICPDSIGCGLSDWTHDKKKDPGLTAYAEMARDLLGQLGLSRVRWIGASKGGGLGLVLAATMTDCVISHLILDDVGPGFPEWLRQAAMKNIASPPHFDSFTKFETYLKEMLTRGGLVLDDKRWRHLSETWCRQNDDGLFTFQNDPALANQFSLHGQDFDLWHHYDRITARTLLIHARKSIVPDHEVAMMITRGPKCKVHQRDGGHISLLHKPALQKVIMDFLKSGE
ncbi:MAG: alpha/beta hydrolase [Alphaproteobacteria bacterium]|nr:alpha/beta hydrolase [Alphaproteobacteria bacterium]